MMKVVTPLSIGSPSTLRDRTNDLRVVQVTFRHDPRRVTPFNSTELGALNDLRHYVRRRLVDYRMHCIESQTVGVVTVEPQLHVLQEESAYAFRVRSIEVDAVPPWRLMAARKIRTVCSEVIAI